MKTKPRQINIQVDDDELRRFREQAYRQGMSLSGWMRWLAASEVGMTLRSRTRALPSTPRVETDATG